MKPCMWLLWLTCTLVQGEFGHVPGFPSELQWSSGKLQNSMHICKRYVQLGAEDIGMDTMVKL